MTANPDMQAIYATGEPALVGAVAAVISQGAQDRIKIFGWDLTAQVIDGIDQGFVEAVVHIFGDEPDLADRDPLLRAAVHAPARAPPGPARADTTLRPC